MTTYEVFGEAYGFLGVLCGDSERSVRSLCRRLWPDVTSFRLYAR